jgi:magnesium-transporting ATPase (P-type)
MRRPTDRTIASKNGARTAAARRDGRVVPVAPEELVVGDVIVLARVAKDS